MGLAARVLCLLLLAMLGAGSAGAADAIGVVLLHGKHGTPKQFATLGGAISGAGYALETPEMCWSQKRIYDGSFAACSADITAAVNRLKAKGITRIVIGGASLGALAAFAYAAAHPDVAAGVIGLAPAANPQGLDKVPDIARDVAAAEGAVAAGQGDTPVVFDDQLNGKPLKVKTTSRIYLDFLGPKSPLIMATTLPKLKAPLLWVAGTEDDTQAVGPKAYARVPKNALSEYVEVDADHEGTPDASVAAVINWLASLKAQ